VLTPSRWRGVEQLKIDDDHEVGESEQVTRFGCGALLGLVAGLGIVLGFTLSSFGTVAAALVAAMVICGLLALIYGDRFWYALKHWFF
jgi:hypothetical protein